MSRSDVPKLVAPRAFNGFTMSIAQLWGSGPKYTIWCGECSGMFKQRLPVVDHPVAQCPYCKALNRMPLGVDHG